MSALRVGAPMWAHKGWQGRFLPDKLERGQQLRLYATWCTAVEGNTTFYGLPSQSTVESWATETPTSFRFVFKVPKVITHDRRLRDITAPMREFLTTIEPLGERAALLSLQLPASFSPNDIELLDRFLARMPESRRCGVEVRHPAFFGPAAPLLTAVLERHHAEWITFDTTTLFDRPPTSPAEQDGWDKKPRLPRTAVAIGPEPVVRYVGRDDIDATIAGWQPWVPVMQQWLAEGRTPTFFLHTPDNDAALGLARQFHDQVRSLVPDLAPLPDPVADSGDTLF